MITNINTGICHYRATKRNEKPFFVNWQQNGQSYYAYFAFRFLAESFKSKMLNENN